MISIYLNTVICAALFYTCFCRLVRTNAETHTSIRLAFVVLASASAWCLAVPLKTGVPPQDGQLVIEAAMALVQGLTARYWRDGVPGHFQRCQCPALPHDGGDDHDAA